MCDMIVECHACAENPPRAGKDKRSPTNTAPKWTNTPHTNLPQAAICAADSSLLDHKRWQTMHPFHDSYPGNSHRICSNRYPDLWLITIHFVWHIEPFHSNGCTIVAFDCDRLNRDDNRCHKQFPYERCSLHLRCTHRRMLRSQLAHGMAVFQLRIDDVAFRSLTHSFDQVDSIYASTHAPNTPAATVRPRSIFSVPKLATRINAQRIKKKEKNKNTNNQKKLWYDQ